MWSLIAVFVEVLFWCLPGHWRRNDDRSIVGKSGLDQEAERFAIGCVVLGAIITIAGLLLWIVFK